MAGRTPIPVARAMRNVAANLDLARRQQRITLELLAERANLSVPTVRRLLNEGAGTFENFLRVARILGMLENVVGATDPLRTPIGRARAEQDVPKRVRGAEMEHEVSEAFRSILRRRGIGAPLGSDTLGQNLVTALHSEQTFRAFGHSPDVRGNPHVCAHGLLAPLSVVRSR